MLRLDLTTLVVHDYDEAIQFFVGVLGFTLVDDTDMGDGKRWVVIRPAPGAPGLLLGKAVGEEQAAAVGNVAGGRVGFILHTDDFDRTVADWTSKGVRLAEEPRSEPYGKVVVFLDLYGNRWDLLEPAAG